MIVRTWGPEVQVCNADRERYGINICNTAAVEADVRVREQSVSQWKENHIRRERLHLTSCRASLITNK